MEDKQFIKLLIASPKFERAHMLYDYMIGKGFQVKTLNYMHCYCRYPEFTLDVWGTTEKMDVKEVCIYGKRVRHNGCHAIVTEINRLHKVYLEN